MLEMKGVIDASDYVRAQYLHLRPRLIYKILGFLVLAAFVWAAWLSLTVGDLDVMDFVFIALPILLILNFAVYLPWKTRRLYKQQKSLQGELTFSFDEDGVTVQSENGSWRTAWTDYVRWKKNDQLVLLYLSDCMYHMIPKRFSTEAGDFDTLCELVGQKLRSGNR